MVNPIKITSKLEKAASVRVQWISILILIVLGTILSVSLYVYYRIEPIVSSRLKETVKTSTNGLFTISFSSLTINPFSGSVLIRDIVFRTDNNVYNRLERNAINPSHVFDIRVKILQLKNVDLLKVYSDRDLAIKSVNLVRPIINVYYDKPLQTDSSKLDTRSAWNRLSKYLNSVKIDKASFKEIEFKYIDKRLRKTEINSIKNLSIFIDDLFIDSLSHRDLSRFYYTKDIRVEVYDNSFLSADKMYTLGFDKFEISTLSKGAVVKGLKVIPRYPEIEFTLKSKFREARYLVEAEELSLNEVNFKSLTDSRQLYAKTMNVKNGKLHVFMNKQLPKKKVDMGQNFPQIILEQLRLTTTIDTVIIQNSQLAYSEYDPYPAKKGKIVFTAINGKILNISNDTAVIIRNNWLSSNFSSYLYGKGRLEFNMNLNLKSAEREYNYSGKLHHMHAKYFNQITRPLALLEVSSGETDSAMFAVHASYRQAKGYLTIVYKDLNIGILKLTENKKLQRSTLLSLVANNLLLKEDNPGRGEKIRKGKILYTRPDSVSFYSMIWKSMFSGIKENIGMTAEREETLKRQFENFKNDDPSVSRESRRKKRALRRTKKH